MPWQVYPHSHPFTPTTTFPPAATLIPALSRESYHVPNPAPSMSSMTTQTPRLGPVILHPPLWRRPPQILPWVPGRPPHPHPQEGTLQAPIAPVPPPCLSFPSQGHVPRRGGPTAIPVPSWHRPRRARAAVQAGEGSAPLQAKYGQKEPSLGGATASCWGLRPASGGPGGQPGARLCKHSSLGSSGVQPHPVHPSPGPDLPTLPWEQPPRRPYNNNPRH